MDNIAQRAITLPPITDQVNHKYSIEELYKISNRQDNFGIDSYSTPVNHVDVRQILQQREFEKQKKGEKNTKYVTKRGHFFDDLIKPNVKFPGPQKYIIKSELESSIEKLKSKDTKKIDKSKLPNKNTYIDKIFFDNKKYKYPGPGNYDTIPTDKQIQEKLAKLKEKKIKGSDRLNFLCDFEHLGSVTPGSGNYNPHSFRYDKKNFLSSSSVTNLNPKEWIKIHGEKNKKLNEKLKSITGPTTYDPQPADFFTFSKFFKKQNEQKNETGKQNFFGTEEKLKDPFKKKFTKSLLINPGVGTYNLVQEWPGKKSSKDKESKPKKNWMNSITKGIEINMYYSNN